MAGASSFPGLPAPVTAFAIAGGTDLYGVTAVIGVCCIARDNFGMAFRARRVGRYADYAGNAGDSKLLAVRDQVLAHVLDLQAFLDPAGITLHIAAEAAGVDGSAFFAGDGVQRFLQVGPAVLELFGVGSSMHPSVFSGRNLNKLIT
jgi:hypothetical protein